MQKYTRAEADPIVLTPAETKKVEQILTKHGKTSARELSDEERTDLNSALDKSEE